MDVNSATLRTINISFNALFKMGLARARPEWQRVAMEVPSTTLTEEYGWLKDLPGIRKWIGPRVINNLSTEVYRITNEDYEETVALKVNQIKDDKIGIFSSIVQKMGQDVAEHPDRLVWPLLKAGFSTVCYDGQFFFDTDHPVSMQDGTVVNVSNTGGGSGYPWFLIDTSQVFKPVIFQNREAFNFVSRTDPSDPHVFDQKEFLYGVDGRCAVGFGFWQLAYGSKQVLDATSYAAARVVMMSQLTTGGRPLGVMPNLLVVHPQLESAGRAILMAQNNANGSTNTWFNSAELLVAKWLA